MTAPGLLELTDDTGLRLEVRMPTEAAGQLAAVFGLPDPPAEVTKEASAAFTRLGYPDVRVYPGGKADWADADLPFEGTRAMPKVA